MYKRTTCSHTDAPSATDEKGQESMWSHLFPRVEVGKDEEDHEEVVGIVEQLEKLATKVLQGREDHEQGNEPSDLHVRDLGGGLL